MATTNVGTIIALVILIILIIFILFRGKQTFIIDPSNNCCDNSECTNPETGTQGPVGPEGPQGLQGVEGPQGPSGVSEFADFYALMPGDNAATIAAGSNVLFPQDGPTSAGGITRLTSSTFELAAIGTYEVSFQVSVAEAGQLILTLNNADIANTVSGRATGTSQIVGTVLINTSVPNSVLTVRNPSGNSTALTLSPNAGGSRPVSAHLVIKQLS